MYLLTSTVSVIPLLKNAVPGFIVTVFDEFRTTFKLVSVSGTVPLVIILLFKRLNVLRLCGVPSVNGSSTPLVTSLFVISLISAAEYVALSVKLNL